MSTLRVAVQQYLSLRRGLGFKLHEAGKALPSFVTFMEQHRASVITSRLALEWAQKPSTVQPAEWARRLSIVRGFARHRSATDPRTEIPPDGLLPYRPKRATPYIYSDQEIRSLLRAALKLPGYGGLRPWTYHCLFWPPERHRPAPRRSAQPGTPGRRSPSWGPDHPGCQVR